ncbi:hypothetical protein C2G38_2221696 [Gigaspora rosea]|uniref:Uncharacterized protein n=1 Tax=Gigaspora rosea TaxID=44941 RepID=A0A397UC53_9GLOM|nr:hypothetical protein C2G38_2221696 [Gigaspora rosea]
MRSVENSASGYLDIISNVVKNIIENKKTEDEESGESNNAQEPYSEKNQVKENDIHKAYNEYTSFDYHQEFGQLSLNNFDQIVVDYLYNHREKSVDKVLIVKLRGCGLPFAKIKAVHSGTGAKNASFETTNGLEPVLFLSIGARNMLMSNLWTNQGLVNKAILPIRPINILGKENPEHAFSFDRLQKLGQNACLQQN